MATDWLSVTTYATYHSRPRHHLESLGDVSSANSCKHFLPEFCVCLVRAQSLGIMAIGLQWLAQGLVHDPHIHHYLPTEETNTVYVLSTLDFGSRVREHCHNPSISQDPEHNALCLHFINVCGSEKN